MTRPKPESFVEYGYRLHDGTEIWAVNLGPEGSVIPALDGIPDIDIHPNADIAEDIRRAVGDRGVPIFRHAVTVRSTTQNLG